MELNVDYKFRPDLEGGTKNDNSTIAIELLMEPYRGIVFRYKELVVQEKEDHAVLKFNYDLIDTASYTKTKLRRLKTFQETLGLILNSLLLASFDDGVDEVESGNNNSKESNKE